MELTGKLFRKFETQKISDSFQKRKFVLLYAENPDYPEYLEMEVIQDKCSLLDSLEENSNISVSVNLKGRLYNHPEKGERFFNTLQAWKIESSGETSTPPSSITASNALDDMPF